MAKEVEVKVPDIGDFKDVPIIEVFVKPGDHVDKDASLVTLESEKATMDVPAPLAGTVKTVKLKVGDNVSEGDLVLVMELADSQEEAAKRAVEPTPARSGRGDAAGAAGADATKAAPPTGDGGGDSRPAARHVDTDTTGGGGESFTVEVPDIGDFSDVPVIEVFVHEGDSIAKDAPLVTIESEKATMDVPAPAAGVVQKLSVKVGDKVSQGTLLLTMQAAGGTKQARPAAKPADAAPAKAADKPAGDSPQAAKPVAGRDEGARAGLPHASPSVRKFARELGVDLTQARGSGPHGRITREDVQSFVKQHLAAAAAGAAGGGIPAVRTIDFSKFGPTESKPLGRIRKISADNLQRAWLNVPHVTQHDEADVSDLEAFRRAASDETGVKLTLLPFLMKAVASALRRYPEFNASLAPDGATLILKQYCHIGFAADTENGLLVPVVRDVWDKGVTTLAQECAALAAKAREGKLKPAEMSGGCFSISSLGGIGGGFFTPIVNAPEVAILGVSRAQTKPVWDGKAFVPRQLLPLSLSYDHRVIDGAAGARFIVYVSGLLADIRKLSL